MADDEIQILITAVDNATEVLNKIQNQLGTANENIQAQTEATTNTFDKQMGSLLVLGNAANSVSHIMETYENMQIRVENAEDRVANAQDRLTAAQDAYAKVAGNAASSTQDIEKAQRNLDIATRNLEVSENRLQQAHNMQVASYISMGVQVINLIGSLPKLVTAVEGFFTAAKAATIATEALTVAEEENTVATEVMTGAEGLGGVASFLTGPWGLAIAGAGIALGFLFAKMQKPSQDAAQTFVDNWGHVNQTLDDTTTKALQATDAMVDLYNTYGKAPPGMGGGGTLMLNEPQVNMSTTEKMAIDTLRGNSSLTSTSFVGDAIIRPNGQIIRTDPNDTLIASKNGGAGGGITVIIEGNIYGVDADDVANALQKQLSKRLTLGN